MKDDIQAIKIIKRLTAAISCLTALFFACPDQLYAALGGDIAWEYQNIDTADQIAAASAVDSAGNIIITGYSNKNGTDDFYTVKIKADHSGVLWRSTLDLAGYSGRAVAVAVDSDDNVIVTGTGNSSDYITKIITIKYCGNTVTTPPGYDSPDGSPYPGLCNAGDPIWTATYAAPSRGNAYPTSLAVDADKNIYVGGAGQPQSGGTNDFILLKYASGGPNGDGSPAWQRSYAGLGADNDRITDVATCSIPNSSQYFVAVTGHIKDSGGSRIHTIKYTSAGVLLWQKTISDPKVNSVDPKITMDSSCNVIVAGSVVRSPGDGDIYTIKYAANYGDTLWNDSIAGNGDNQPNDIYIDTDNNVLLVGRTYENGQNYNFYTARLNNSTGAILWQKTYDSGGNLDEALSVAVDTVTSSVYVLGRTWDTIDYDFRTIKYSLADGNLLWNKSFDGATGNQSDHPIGINLNAAGEVLVSGYIDTVVSGTSFDYYAIKYYPGLLDPPTDLNASFRPALKIALTWTRNSVNETGFEIHRSTKSFEISNDSLIHTTSANVTAYNDSDIQPNTRYYYRVRAKEVVGQVTNMSHSSNQASVLTTIFYYDAPNWQRTYNGEGNRNDEAYAIAIGPDLNPVITGYGTTSSIDTNYLTIKLDRSSGSVLWANYLDYTSANNETAYDVAVASDNGILITGTAPLYSNGVTSFDIKTAAYNSSVPLNGSSIWEYYFDKADPHGRTEYGSIVAYSNNDDTWAMAGFGVGDHGMDIYLAHLGRNGTEEKNGQPLWPDGVKTYDSGGYDTPTGMIFDSHGDLIVSGNCNGTTSNGPFDILLMKYNDSTGANIWTQKYDHHGGDDRSSGIILDQNDDIYLTGYVTNDSSKNFYTAKYDGATGDRLWYKTYNGPANGDDTAAAIAFDKIGRGEVIVGGTRLSAANNHDFFIVRYDPADGTVIREIPLDRILDDDHLLAMGTDASGSMCVVGTTGTAGGGEDIIGVRYDWDGTYIDSMKFNGSGNGADIPYDVAANSLGEIFVAGTTKSVNNLDYLVLKCNGNVVQTPFPFTLTPYYTSIDLSWADNSLNESGFEIERDQRACLENDSWIDWQGKQITISAADTTVFTDDAEVSPHQPYCYRIRTISNDSKTSRWVYQQTTTLDPHEPTNLTATKLHTTGIKLDWDDNTNGETEFIIERCEGVNCDADDANFEIKYNAAANSQTWTDLSLCPGKTYSYRVKARNNNSNTWTTATSATATASTDAIVAPSFLQATRGSEGRINLSWNDSNLNESGVKIYRCQNNGCTDFTELTSLTPNPPSANVIPDTSYLADANTDRAIELLMDESSWSGAANEVKDQSANQAHGRSYNGANTIADPSRGRVGDFDGVNDYINLGTPAALQGTGSQTIAFWINPDTLSVRSNPYSKAYGGEGAITIETGETSGQVNYYYGTSGTTAAPYQAFTMTSALTAGTWTHLAIVRDLTAMKLRWYKNGVLVNETPALFSAAGAGTLPVYIGTGYTGKYFDGKLDEFIILNRALSGAEIANLYNPPTVYADTNVLPDTTYRYQVSAFNNDSDCPWETSHTAIAANTSSLATPATLSGTVLNTTKVNLSWQDHFESENGYILQRCDTTLVATCDNDSDFTVSTTIETTATSYNDSTVKENRSYAYRVKGIKTTAPAWQSPYSNSVTLHTNAKAVPFDFNVSRVNEEEILLTWSTADTDQDGFQIFRCQNASCTSYTLLKTIGPGSSAFTDTHLSSDTTYRYQVKAFKNLNSQENEWLTSSAALRSGGSDTAVTTIYVPTLSTAKATSSTTISLVWDDPTGRETDFNIERCTGVSCNDFVQVGSAGRDSTRYTDSSSDICMSSTYTYRVQAVERGLSSGNGDCWYKKKQINFSNFIAYYPIRLTITFTDGMQNDFDDIRFYDETEKHEIPYWLESKTDGDKAYVWIMTGGNNNIYLYYNNPVAFNASDPASVSVFINSSYYDFFDNFAGRKNSIDSTKWVEIDTDSNKISQDNGLLLNSVGLDAWDTALISQNTFSRTPGKSASAGISSIDTTNGTSMFGWDRDQTTGTNHTQLVHGLQFTHSTDFHNPKPELRPYEKGNQAGSSSITPTYTEVDIRLTATGASYWHDGTQFNTSNSYNDSPLRLAFHQKRHKAKVYWVAVRIVPATAPITFGPMVNISSCPSANNWTGAYSNTMTVSTETVPASAPTEIEVTPLSDASMLGVTWTSNTADEDAFYLQRCDNDGNFCPAGNDSLFSTVATIKKTSYLTSLIPPEMALYMDETSWSGSTGQVVDSSGKGVNATAHGGASTVLDEVRGQVGTFDGSDDYVEIPGDTTLQHTTDSSYTFAAWVKPAKAPDAADALNSSYGILIRPGYNSGLRYTSNKKFSFISYTSAGNLTNVVSAPTDPGFWHHVVGVANDSSKTIYLYVDGELQSTNSYTGTLRDYGTGSYYVGVGNPGTWYFDGLIDEPRIFNKALSAAEVLALYAGPSTYSYTDTGLIPGSPYTYRVQAVKSGNCDWSLTSTASTGTTKQSEAVPDFSAARDPDNTYNTINLSWQDQSHTNTGFVIVRSQGSDCNDSSGAYAEIATVYGNDTTYSDTSLCPGASYCYGIKGINQAFDDMGYGLSNNGDNTPWSRRKALSITNFQANYQTKLEIAWDPDMQENFADIRFFDPIANRELPYWIEKLSNGGSATVWLKTGDNDSIKMYYGNPNATSSSDGTSVFTFFDDFNDGVIDPAKWPSKNTGSSITETGGELKVTQVQGGTYYIQSLPFAGTASPPFVLTARTKSISTPADGWSPAMWYKGSNEGMSILDYPPGSNRQVVRLNGSWAYFTPSYIPLDQWHQNSVILKTITTMTANVEFETAPSRNWHYDSETTTTQSASYYIKIGPRQDGSDNGVQNFDGRVDWIFMRKWAAIEPTVTMAAEEEEGGTVWSTAYAFTATPGNQLTTPAPPSNVSVSSVSEAANSLTWTDNLDNEDGYLIERCQGSTCSDFNVIAKVSKNFKDDFSSGIEPNYWNSQSVVVSKNDSVPPIYINDSSGSGQIFAENGKVILHTVANNEGYNSYNTSTIYLKNPEVLGNDDFDIQIDFNLPNPILDYNMYHVYARLMVMFNTADDYFYSQRYHESYYAGFLQINHAQESANLLTAPVSSGKLRLTRSENVLSTYIWNNDQWLLLKTHSQMIPAHAAVKNVFLSQYAYRGETARNGVQDLTTELDNFQITQKTGAFTFLDTGAMVAPPFNTIVQPANWNLSGLLESGEQTVAPIAVNDSSGSATIDLSKGTASLHTSSTGAGSSENYNRSSLNLKMPGEVVLGNQNFDLQLKFNISKSTCSKAANGLEVYLKMEEDAWNGIDDEVLDYSGINRHGKAVGGATIINDSIRGKVGYFDGVNAGVISQLLTGNKIISLGGEHTITAWFNASTSSGNYPWLVAFSNDLGGGSYSSALAYNNNGVLRAWTADTSGLRVGLVVTPYLYNDSSWHHAAYTYSTANRGNLYIDGILVATETTNPTSDIRDGETFTLGRMWSSAAHVYQGLIDDARIFSRELSKSEVRLLANDSFPDDGIVPIGIRIGFDNNDFLTLERSGGTNGEYFASGMINSTAETKSKATSAASGRLRINRSGDIIYASYWNGSDWTTLQARSNLPSSAQVTSVQIYNQAARDSICELDTTVSSLIITANNSTHYYFDNESLISGRPYTYRVSPYKEGNTCSNWTSFSGSASMTPAAIPAPSGLTTTGVGTTQVDLRWTDSTSSETNFEIQRCTGSCNFSSGVGNDTKTFTVAANVSTFSDMTAVHSTDYLYRVKAINTTVPWSSNDSSVLPVRTLAPIAPSDLVVTYASEIRLNLAWHDNSPDESNFMVERGDANCTPSSFNLIATLAAGTTSYSDSGLNDSTTYCYRVVAYKNPGYGNSWYSAYSNSVFKETTVNPPSNLLVTASTFDTTRISLSWNDNTESETGFSILRCTGSNDNSHCSDLNQNWSEINRVGQNTVSYQDNSACDTTTYFYRIKAVKMVNNIDVWANGNKSNTENATTMTPEPAFNFKVTEINNDSNDFKQMQLYWEYNDSDKSGFTIERCTGENCTDFVQKASIPTPQTHDSFDTAIDTSFWKTGGEIQGVSSSDTYEQPPINMSNTYGAIKVTAAGDGKVELYAQAYQYSGTLNPIERYTQAFMKLADPSLVGPGDFDIQVTFTLPDEPIAPHSKDHSYIRMLITFPDRDGDQRLDSDYAYIDYKLNKLNYNGDRIYSTSVQINNIIQSNDSSPIFDSTGKLRVMRHDNIISTYYWDNTSGVWKKLLQHDTAQELNQIPDKVQISNMAHFTKTAYEDVTLRTEIEDFKIAKSSFSYTDNLDLASFTTYRYKVVPYKDNDTIRSGCTWGGDLNNPIAMNLTRPIAPTGLTATVLNNTVIKLEWTDSNHTENGYYADGYEVERLTWNGYYQKIYTSYDRDKTFTNDSRSYITSAGNEPGKKYTYRVRAYRGEDKSAYSNAATTSDKYGNETTTEPFDHDHPENYNHRPSE